MWNSPPPNQLQKRKKGYLQCLVPFWPQILYLARHFEEILQPWLYEVDDDDEQSCYLSDVYILPAFLAERRIWTDRGDADKRFQDLRYRLIGTGLSRFSYWYLMCGFIEGGTNSFSTYEWLVCFVQPMGLSSTPSTRLDFGVHTISKKVPVAPNRKRQRGFLGGRGVPIPCHRKG